MYFQYEKDNTQWWQGWDEMGTYMLLVKCKLTCLFWNEVRQLARALKILISLDTTWTVLRIFSQKVFRTVGRTFITILIIIAKSTFEDI